MPNTLDLACEAQPLQTVIPQNVIVQAAQVQYWVVENAKTTRAFLKRIDAIEPLCQPLQALSIQELPKPRKGAEHATQSQAENSTALKALLAPAVAGNNIGVLSEAGLPAIADPGGALVAMAHQMNLGVQALSGPSSLMMALSSSGLHGQRFSFVGYLPQDNTERAARIKALEQRSQREHETQLFIETPYRNETLFSALLQQLKPTTRLSVACALTLPEAWVRTLTVAQWRQTTVQFNKGLPCVFSFLA